MEITNVKETLTGFEAYLTAKNLHEDTLKRYIFVARNYIIKSKYKICLETAKKYLEEFYKKKSNTMVHHGVKTFLEYNGMKVDAQQLHLKKKPTEVNYPELSKATFSKILAGINREDYKIISLLMYFSGWSFKELIKLQKEDFNINHNNKELFYITSGRRTITVKRQYEKHIYDFVKDKVTYVFLDEQFDTYNRCEQARIINNELSYLNTSLRESGHLLGFKKITSQSLRVQFMRSFLHHGGLILQLQELLGYKSVLSLLRYVNYVESNVLINKIVIKM